MRLADRVSAAQIERLRLVARLAGRADTTAWLVGGAVRDALLGEASLDLDVTVEGDPLPLARSLAEALGGRLTVHERFGTAAIESGEFHFDVATARRETYPHPGALPVVEPASLDEDLRRRDFSVNALALRLDSGLDTLYDPLGGRADLGVRAIRGLDEATFRDDPTRVIRAARYAARLGGGLEAQTEGWLLAAVNGDALATITGTRQWQELRRLLWEGCAPAALALLQDWQALPALGLCPPREGALRELYGALVPSSLALVPSERALAVLGLLAEDAGAAAEHFGLTAEERRVVVAAGKLAAAPPPCVFAAAPKSSTLYETLGRFPQPALLALWVRYPASRPALLRYGAVAELRPDVDGRDLQSLGFAPSAGFTPALQAALRAKLDDHANEEEQLAAAREALTRWQRQDGL
jgi:tRNA nucleotidyltransferase (CCA-adding enzyme)